MSSADCLVDMDMEKKMRIPYQNTFITPNRYASGNWDGKPNAELIANRQFSELLQRALGIFQSITTTKKRICQEAQKLELTQRIFGATLPPCGGPLGKPMRDNLVRSNSKGNI